MKFTIRPIRPMLGMGILILGAIVVIDLLKNGDPNIGLAAVGGITVALGNLISLEKDDKEGP